MYNLRQASRVKRKYSQSTTLLLAVSAALANYAEQCTGDIKPFSG